MISEWPTVQQKSLNTKFSIVQLIDTYYVQIVRLANSILHNQHDAEDAAQEIFVQAQRNLKRFRGDASIKTWLFAIGINHCRRRLRRKQFKQLVLSVVDNKATSESTLYPEQMAIANESHRLLWSAVDQLKEKHKLPILLRHVHGLSGKEIAQVLNISEGTVYSRIHYAQKQLKAQLEHEPAFFEAR